MTLELTTTGAVPEQLRSRLERRTARVGVVGLGHLGLPSAEAFARAGYPVLGLDIDPEKIKQLKTGRSYLGHVCSQRIAELVAAGRLQATTDAHELRDADAVVLCVPTPLTDAREPDLSYITGAGQTVGKHLRRGQLVVLESATYPGTTEDLLCPLLEQTGLRAGRDFFLAYSPVREDPGYLRYPARASLRVVGGVDPVSRDLAAALYEPVVGGVILSASTKVAEACKMLESAYRAVNTALVNELKVVFEALGVDVWEVIAAARTKPFGFQAFAPGPGTGGHDVAVDPLYLAWAGRNAGAPARVVELAGDVNRAMPAYVVRRVETALAERGQTIRGSRVCVLGVAYKKNVEDLQQSPALAILGLLKERGAFVAYNDPYIHTLTTARDPALRLDSEPLSPDFLAAQDCVLIVTDHSAYNYDWIVRHAPLVIDTRNATAGVGHGDRRVVKA